MTRHSRAEADRIHHQGFVYFPFMPPSEQYPALTVTRKFSKRIDPEDVDLTQREMAGFVSVYPRLYQVPKTMQERIRRWYLANRKLADSWPLDGFWNAAEDDTHDNIVVREPGVPPEAKQIAGIEDSGNGKPAKEKKPRPPKAKREQPSQPSTSNTSQATPFPDSVVARCPELEQWSQQAYFAAELKAAERSFGYIRGWVEDAQSGGRSPSIVQLNELMNFASNALTRASEAVKISSAVVEDLKSSPAPLIHPAFVAWQEQQQQTVSQEIDPQPHVEHKKRPFEVVDAETNEEKELITQTEPSGAGKVRKLSTYRSAPESRSGDSTPLPHREYDQTGSNLPGPRAISTSAPIHPAFLQQYASQQPQPVPSNHTHSSFMVAPTHGSSLLYVPIDNDNQQLESASESGGGSGGHGDSNDDEEEEEDEEEYEEEEEEEDGGDDASD